MLSKKPLIAIFAIAFFVCCSDGHGQENRIPQEQVCFGNSLPTRIRFQPDNSLKIGLHSLGIETIARQSGTLMLFRFKGDNRPEEPVKPDTRCCFFLATGASPDSGVEAKTYCRAASNEGSGSEDSGCSDESSDNRSNEEETDAHVEYVTTTPNPFRVLNEINQYCAALALKKIKQEPVSDNEILTESHLPADQRPKMYQCDHEGCDYSTDYASNVKRHKQTHLPADQRPKMYQCDHEGCDYSTDYAGNVKRHKQTHLPADQVPKRPKRLKVHQCDHEDCNYSATQFSYLKLHKLTHLPADQRPKVHRCNYEGCNYSAAQLGNLNVHKQTHLPADQRPKKPKVHHCDHEDCNYSTDITGNLKKHKQIHLPANQRAKRPKVHQCDHEDCDYRTDYTGNLKRHKRTHLPADQRPKRKAYDQPPSNKKRKKDDKE
ncbi:hypothetical protein [Endozoicomonas sp. 4G]|uniref:hypothetical protein n=1 Tax=Endozoicomonas sp. 4G TaxID=2872754 RepID=UPI0020789084|nr:hypothetical protein [Endozoicomonas sp. 4G]